MKMKLKTLAAYLTALTVMLGTVAVMAVGAGANDDDWVERVPTIDLASQGWRVNDFSARGGNEVALNDSHTADNEVGAGDLNLIFEAEDSFDAIHGVRVQLFLDWSNTNWGDAEAWEDDGEPGESPWANHRISIITQGICGERPTRLPANVDPTGKSWRQWNFDVVRSDSPAANQIQYGAESVTLTVPIVPDADEGWAKIIVMSWDETPGYAIVNLLDESGEIIPIVRVVCHLCDRGWTTEDCQCPVEVSDPNVTTPGGTGTSRPGGDDENEETGIAITLVPVFLAAGAAGVAIFTKKRK
jgi:hypothetical protein